MRHLIIRIGRTFAIVAALALVAGGSLARVAPAAVSHPAFAAGCQGGTSQPCTGLDPIAEGCNAVSPDPVTDVRQAMAAMTTAVWTTRFECFSMAVSCHRGRRDGRGATVTPTSARRVDSCGRRATRATRWRSMQ